MENNSFAVGIDPICLQTTRTHFIKTSGLCFLFIVLVLVSHCVLAALPSNQGGKSSTKTRTPITATVACDRTIMVSSPTIDVGVLDGAKDAIAAFSLAFPGNQPGTLRMETGPHSLLNVARNGTSIPYVMKISSTSGFNFESAVGDPVLSNSGELLHPQSYDVNYVLGRISDHTQPKLSFTLTLSAADIAKAPQGVYQRTIKFEIKGL